MSIPGEAATSETANVSEIVKKVTIDGEGNIVFPEGVALTEEMKFAVTAEKRRRDTQSLFTKTQKDKIGLEAENAQLKELLLKQSIVFTPEQNEELEDLKLENPEAWRQKLNEYETQVLEGRKTQITTVAEDVKKESAKSFDLSLRSQVLEEFNKTHGIRITEELLSEEVPNRIAKKLIDGKISYEDYLEECLTYLTTNKAIKEEEVMNNPNLNKASGGKEPGKIDLEPSLNELYSKDLY